MQSRCRQGPCRLQGRVPCLLVSGAADDPRGSLARGHITLISASSIPVLLSLHVSVSVSLPSEEHQRPRGVQPTPARPHVSLGKDPISEETHIRPVLGVGLGQVFGGGHRSADGWRPGPLSHCHRSLPAASPAGQVMTLFRNLALARTGSGPGDLWAPPVLSALPPLRTHTGPSAEGPFGGQSSPVPSASGESGRPKWVPDRPQLLGRSDSTPPMTPARASLPEPAWPCSACRT